MCVIIFTLVTVTVLDTSIEILYVFYSPDATFSLVQNVNTPGNLLNLEAFGKYKLIILSFYEPVCGMYAGLLPNEGSAFQIKYLSQQSGVMAGPHVY